MAFERRFAAIQAADDGPHDRDGAQDFRVDWPAAAGTELDRGHATARLCTAGGLGRGVARGRSPQLAAGDSEVFFIGGGEIYRQVLPRIERIYLTLVHAEVSGDTHFPELPPDQWRLVQRTDHAADEKNDFPFSFLVYERVKAMSDDVKRELLDLTERLLASIAARDWATYQSLCDPSLSASSRRHAANWWKVWPFTSTTSTSAGPGRPATTRFARRMSGCWARTRPW